MCLTPSEHEAHRQRLREQISELFHDTSPLGDLLRELVELDEETYKEATRPRPPCFVPTYPSYPYWGPAPPLNPYWISITSNATSAPLDATGSNQG